MQAENVAVKKQEILAKCETLFKEISVLDKIANEILEANKTKTEYQIWLEATALVDANEILKEKKYTGTEKIFFPMSMEQKNNAIDKQAQLLLNPIGVVRSYMKSVASDINEQLYALIKHELQPLHTSDITWEIVINKPVHNKDKLSDVAYLVAIRQKVEEFIDLMLKNIK